MSQDEVMAEVRRVKEALAAQYGYNVRRLMAGVSRRWTKHPKVKAAAKGRRRKPAA